MLREFDLGGRVVVVAAAAAAAVAVIVMIVMAAGVGGATATSGSSSSRSGDKSCGSSIHSSNHKIFHPPFLLILSFLESLCDISPNFICWVCLELPNKEI